ncbi:MAG: hypothetical protein NT062_03610, partial [Proteobacteria bacterium]|nr:hypothetical protein [Pseudomonadota bacterium]
ERLALEAHEAAARARHQAELDALRVREELDLRRIEAKQKRPRWMIAVTALATVATGVLIWFSVQSIGESEASNHAAAVATLERDNAIKEQQTSAAELASLQARIAALDVQVSQATRRVLDAQSGADRQRASADLKAARDAKVAAQREAEAAEARRQAKIRKDGVHDLCVGQAVCR